MAQPLGTVSLWPILITFASGEVWEKEIKNQPLVVNGYGRILEWRQVE